MVGSIRFMALRLGLKNPLCSMVTSDYVQTGITPKYSPLIVQVTERIPSTQILQFIEDAMFISPRMVKQKKLFYSFTAFFYSSNSRIDCTERGKAKYRAAGAEHQSFFSSIDSFSSSF